MRRIAIFILAGLSGCGSAIDRDSEGYELTARRWFAGDFHVHSTGASNDTGGDSHPADIKKVALQRGLDFVVLTDHSNSAGSDPTTRDERPELFNLGPEFVYFDEARALSDASFLMISGSEISPQAGDELSGPNGHVGCVPAELEGFDEASPFVDRPFGAVNGASALRQARDRGCFSIVNHPFEHAPWIRFDWTSDDYDAIEVWNGGAGFDERDQEAHDAWRCDLFNGKQVTPIGASDNHRVHREPPGELLHPALGYPHTSVFADSLQWPAIVAALRAGHVAIHEGGSALYLETYDADLRHADGAAVRVIRLRGALDASVVHAELRLVRVTGCDDHRSRLKPPDVTDQMIFGRGVRAGYTFDERVDVSAPGVYTATLLGDGIHFNALSRAVVIP